MVITYFSYGAYMPHGSGGIQDTKKPHHEWSWWPCKNEGTLKFNKNQAPFESLKNELSGIKFLDAL